ncbi:Trp biosynthesis-associated membrane protein [Paeniglutamicibacter antarcticus]|uniref:Trp biosynthesis-associated membrane protein n=2 Tax=Arthrobacter terrae TaxID=2935737 RepID=A0A931CLY5_9MICC|nr:Trp biosynthesis-associated membrane protein [Arthrobacter terrae]
MREEAVHGAQQKPAGGRTAGRRAGRLGRKSTLIMLAVISSLVVFGTTTQTWVHVKLGEGVVQQADLNVAGSKAATAVTALALVALAGALAASIGRRISRVVAAVIIFLGAVGIIVSSVAVVLNPQAAAAGPVGTATGVTGQNSDVTTTAFPLIAVGAAVILALAAVLIAWLGRTWNQRTKYDAAGARTGGVSAARPGSATESTPGSTTGSTTGVSADSTAAQPIPVVRDDIDSWDELSHGNDPTA